MFNHQRGFSSIQIILFIAIGLIVVGGITGGVLYYLKSGKMLTKCGDGVCDISEKAKCSQDCSSDENKYKDKSSAADDISLEEINFHRLATGKDFGDILKLFNPVIDEKNRRLYVAGSKTTNVGIVDLEKDELVEVFDIGVPGGFLIFNDQKLYSFDFSANKCHQIDTINKKASEVSINTCTALAPGKNKDKSVKWGDYSFKETGYQSFSDGTTGFSVDWSQDLNGAYGIIEIYNSSSVKVGRIIHGPDALYFTIDSKTGKLYTTNTGDGSISIFDLNKLEKTNYCKDNSCLIKEIDIGNSVDEVIADSVGNLYVRNRLGGSVIYKYNINSNAFTVINNENHISGGIGMWPTDMELSNDEKRLYVLSHYGALIDVVDTATNKVASKIKFSTSLKPRTDSISAMAVDKKRDRVYAVWPELGVIGAADGLNNKVLGSIDLTKYGFDKSKAANAGPGQVNIAVDDKNGELYAYFSGKIVVFDGGTLKSKKEFSATIDKKGEGVLVVNGEKGELYLGNKIFNTEDPKEIGSFSNGQKVIAFNNEINAVYVSDSAQSTKVFLRQLNISEFIDGSLRQEWTVDNLGEIINTFFDFENNIFYIADFLSGVVKKYDLSSGSVPSSGARLNGDTAPSGGTQQSKKPNTNTGTSGAGLEKCGDGICEDVERTSRKCQTDCKQ